jgi:hypothetical protein
MKLLQAIASLFHRLLPQQHGSLYWSQMRRQCLLRGDYRAASACARKHHEALLREQPRGGSRHA